MNGGVKMLFLLISPFGRMLAMNGGVKMLFTYFPFVRMLVMNGGVPDALFYLFPHL